MEMKAVSYLLPFLLLVTIRFSTSVEAVLPVCPLYPPSRCHPSLEAVDTEAMAPPPVERHGSHPMIEAPAAHSPEKTHHHAPAHSPEKPHNCHHGPGKAPCHDPEKHHYRHAHGPMHPPVLREGNPFPNRKPDCPERCGKYCKKDDHKKGEKEECVKACTVCCKKFECVPREHNKKCKWSSEVKMGGETVKCPQ